MELIYTSPNNISAIYMAFPVALLLSIWMIYKVKNRQIKDKLGVGILILMMLVVLQDAKYTIERLQKILESQCSIDGCEIVTGEVVRYRSYKDRHQTNEFYIGNQKFKLNETGNTFTYGVIAEKGGVLTPNSGIYKLYIIKGEIIKLWRISHPNETNKN
ncbi:hypothetical protein [Photobacterium sanguinicancri]|uniref:hypothetical protein n=1 Tax=Photobacterium sanguinicancri TaxID=875932 RepID=UPI0026E2EB57|nr:hypothetical protein [Photobacterium sanguinicancri]MDO6498052.1 hypothetical protein [Photobacterium sanguinicancri]